MWQSRRIWIAFYQTLDIQLKIFSITFSIFTVFYFKCEKGAENDCRDTPEKKKKSARLEDTLATALDMLNIFYLFSKWNIFVYIYKMYNNFYSLLNIFLNI